MSQLKVCDTCSFWDRRGEEDIGLCRKNCPVVEIISVNGDEVRHATLWPTPK